MNSKSFLILTLVLFFGYELRADHPVRPEMELLITAPEVVNSERTQYPGEWSFGKLMEENYGEILAPIVVRSWLLSFTIPEKVNGHLVPPRPLMMSRVIRPWQKKDGFSGENNLDWMPDLKNAPFSLLSIVNRQDISTVRGSASGLRHYYESDPRLIAVGELRFVFCVIDESGESLSGGMTVILEYAAQTFDAAPRKSRQERLHESANYWHGLSLREDFDEEYLEALAELTVMTTRPSADSESASLNLLIAGQSSSQNLLRIRTNDRALGPGREFRQFDSTGNMLFPAALSSTPAQVFYERRSREQKALTVSLNEGTGLPTEIEIKGVGAIPVLAGRALVEEGEEGEEAVPWDAVGVSSEVRRHLSRNSCIGCHGGEVGEGFHIGPSLGEEPAKVSKFLSSLAKRETTRDAVSPRYYRQPGELARRVEIHKALLNERILKERNFAKLLVDDKFAAH